MSLFNRSEYYRSAIKDSQLLTGLWIKSFEDNAGIPKEKRTDVKTLDTPEKAESWIAKIDGSISTPQLNENLTENPKKNRQSTKGLELFYNMF